MRRLLFWLGLGILLQLPLTVAWISRQVHLTTEEIRAAVAPISELSLPSTPTEEQYQFRIEIPADRGSWHRIMRLWGVAPVVLIATSGDALDVLDLTESVISAEVTDRGRAVATRWTRFAPYGYSAEPNARTLEFDVRPATELAVSVNPNRLRQRGAKLQVLFAWRDVAIKDALDSAVMDAQLASVGKAASLIGGLVLLIVLGGRRFRRA